MKILHIWDQAGVACILAKHQRALGHDVRILKRCGYDPFQIFQFYGEPLLDMDGKSFINNAIRDAKQFDTIHVHSLYKIIPDLKRKYAEKTLVLHYHGSEARTRSRNSIQENAEEMCDVVIGSTADLVSHVGKKMIHIPNPVDTAHFRPNDSHRKKNGRALTFMTTDSDIGWVIRYLRENNIDLSFDVIDRKMNPVPYSQMPGLLRDYSTYVDLKFVRGALLPAPSKTALECLACGLCVLNHQLHYLDEFPEEHRPELVAARVLETYRK
jgi:glycosyltransferase involved in cell wall biosynthesis